MKNFKERREIIAEIKKKEIKKEEIKEKIDKTKNIITVLIYKLRIVLVFFVKKIKMFKKLLINTFLGFYSNSNEFTKYVLGICKKCWSSFLKKINSKFYTFLLKNRYGIIGLSFLILGILNFNNLFIRFSKESLEGAVQKINFWPTLPFSNILISKKMFELGYYEQSLNYYEKAKKLKSYVFFKSINNKDFYELENIVLLPQELEANLLKISLEQEKFSYSWEIALEKAKLEYTLSKEGELEKSLAFLIWLNPKKFEGFEEEFQKN